ncbi:MAG: major tail protein [Anaerolineae bacterium]
MTINEAEYKSVVGLDQVYIAQVTADSAAAFTANTPEYLAPAADAAAEPTTSQEMQYADDKPFDVVTGEGETKITLTLTNVPFEMVAKLLGKTFDAASGRMFDEGSGSIPPDFALSFRSMRSNGSYRYFQYLKGKFGAPKDEAQTVGASKTPKPQQLVYTAVNTIHKFDLGGSADQSVKRVVGDEDADNFSGATWFSQVQTPEAVAPSALSLSSSVPTDGATGVVVTADQTLTFNNALPNTQGILLLKVSDGTVVAGALSLDATKKIVTMNPTANLTASTDYLLVYAVTDIYGQTLQGAVNFTTA